MNYKMLHNILYFTLISSFVLIEGNDEYLLKGKLKFAQILFRHGDRTPVDPYPKDPWNDLKYWPIGWGQLTNIGKMQHYKLGGWLRNRYKDLLNDTYSRGSIYVRSTDVDRTLMSAESNLAGFFPPKNNELWNNNINWQPIPVHTIPEKIDEVLAAKKFCPAYNYALSELKATEEFQNLDRKFAKLYKYLTVNTGRKINSLEGVEKIYNCLFIENLYNLTLPEWTKSVFPDGDMQWISNFSFATVTYTRKLARLRTGPLLKEILNRFNDKINKKLKPNRSLWMYSAHDMTVASLLNTLKLFEYHSPPYAACVLIELRIHDDEPLISVFYKNSSIENPPPLIIPGCGRSCPLSKMFELYSDVIPTDWDSECKISTLMMTYEEANIGYAMGILAGIAASILMITLLYSSLINYRRRHYFNYNLHVDAE